MISDPLRLVASTITVPRVMPEITRFRMGKFAASGGVPGGNSVRIRPPSAMARVSLACERGYTRSMPVPRTAIVFPEASRAAVCDAASMPRASPETITMPAETSCRARCAAAFIPYGDARRDPTIATIGCCSSERSPR